MKLISVTPLDIPDVKVVKFGRFKDDRGYFTESYRWTQLHDVIGSPISQINESVSIPDVVRGLHFQWNPLMGKLVRTVYGRMVDLFVDIRPDSPTFGQGSMYDMRESTPDADEDEWIWVPPGFAHGNFFTRHSRIIYACTGHHSPGCEVAISPLAPDIDWGLAPTKLRLEFDDLVHDYDGEYLKITDKDRNGLTIEQWRSDHRAVNFRWPA